MPARIISLIAAVDRNGLIGSEGKLPWHLPADLKHFKKLTIGHPVVMGRRTFESLGKPLSNRRNVVLTKDYRFKAEGAETVHSVEEALQILTEGEVFVIGGAQVFKDFLPWADRIYLTVIDQEFAGDTFFPEFNQEDWFLVSETAGKVDDENPYFHRFLVYERIKK